MIDQSYWPVVLFLSVNGAIFSAAHLSVATLLFVDVITNRRNGASASIANYLLILGFGFGWVAGGGFSFVFGLHPPRLIGFMLIIGGAIQVIIYLVVVKLIRELNRSE